MSGRKKRAAWEYAITHAPVEVTVIRSADGKKSKILIPLSSTTLNGLKDVIGSDRTLGPVRRDQQRLFHLGRELKSGNRSLSALGIGNHNVFSVHLHSLAPKTVDLQSEDEANDSGMGSVRKGGHVAANSNGGVIDLESSTGMRLVGGGDRPGNANGYGYDGQRPQQLQKEKHQQPPRQRQRQRQRQEEGREKVVDLLDSDSDDEVEIVETVPKRRRRN